MQGGPEQTHSRTKPSLASHQSSSVVLSIGVRRLPVDPQRSCPTEYMHHCFFALVHSNAHIRALLVSQVQCNTFRRAYGTFGFELQVRPGRMKLLPLYHQDAPRTVQLHVLPSGSAASFQMCASYLGLEADRRDRDLAQVKFEAVRTTSPSRLHTHIHSLLRDLPVQRAPARWHHAKDSAGASPSGLLPFAPVHWEVRHYFLAAGAQAPAISLLAWRS